ncbi:MAG: CHASE2 domain-containing protein, partial [Alphaproteobacteria bacterium]
MTSSQIRRALKQIGGLRLIVTAGILLLALLIARMSWTVPLAMDAERALYDVRQLVSAPRVPQDGRIVMVVFTEETLTATGKRFPLDRGLLAKALTNLDALGPNAIGVDILIDQAQPEDDQLAAGLLAMKTPTYLAYASNDTNATFMQPWQQAFLQKFLGRLDGSATHPASIRIEADPDNVMRSWPSQPEGLPPLLANAMAPDVPGFRDYQGRIRFRQAEFADRPIFASLPIDLFASADSAAALRSMIAGRYVLVGADIPDIDRFEVPATRLSKASIGGLETGATISGLEVHANLLAQLLDGWKPKTVPALILWLAAIAVVAMGALTGIADMPAWRTGIVLVLQLALLLVLPFILQARGVDTDGVPMFGWATGWILSFSSIGAAARAVGSQERRFAQSALGKY